MKCPSCGSADTIVRDSRPTSVGGIRRRRLCEVCTHRFTTVEIAVESVPPHGIQHAAYALRQASLAIADAQASIKSLYPARKYTPRDQPEGEPGS